jgi:hypothetical protein
MGRLVRTIIDHLVADCPLEQAGCADCNEPRCPREQFETCRRRLVASSEEQEGKSHV